MSFCYVLRGVAKLPRRGACFARAFVKNFGKSLYIRYLVKSYSQYGEDLLIDKILGHKKVGFYVDIGANDPEKFNNTLKFYRRGWCGINIEPNVVLHDRICKKRLRDINLNIGVGRENSCIPFYLIDPDTLSTFDKDTADKAVSEGFCMESVQSVDVLRLDQVLHDYAENKLIDFLSLDVEGFELEVLESNDWKRFRPNIIMIEVNRAEESINNFMKSIGYQIVYSNGTNTIFRDIENNSDTGSNENRYLQ